MISFHNYDLKNCLFEDFCLIHTHLIQPRGWNYFRCFIVVFWKYPALWNHQLGLHCKKVCNKIGCILYNVSFYWFRFSLHEMLVTMFATMFATKTVASFIRLHSHDVVSITFSLDVMIARMFCEMLLNTMDFVNLEKIKSKGNRFKVCLVGPFPSNQFLDHLLKIISENYFLNTHQILQIQHDFKISKNSIISNFQNWVISMERWLLSGSWMKDSDWLNEPVFDGCGQ